MGTIIAAVGLLLVLLASTVKFARTFQKEWSITARMLDPFTTILGMFGGGAYLGAYLLKNGGAEYNTILIVGFAGVAVSLLVNLALLIDAYNRRKSGDGEP